MNQIFFIELKQKCDEIKNDANNTEKINQVIKAYDTILHFTNVARQEGLLALEEEMSGLGTGSEPDLFFKFMIMMVIDGTEPVFIEEAGMNRCIAFNLPSYDGLINLMYFKGAAMIQAGNNPMLARCLLETMMPPDILRVLKHREHENALPEVSEKVQKENNLIASLCKENDKTDKHDYSIVGQLAVTAERLSDKEMQRMLREIDNNTLSMAMKGLPGTARKKFFDNLSSRLGYMIAENIVFIGPVRQKDVEESCAKIMKIYVQLADSGEIISTDTENGKLVLDIYETAQKQNKEIKEKYNMIKQLIDKIYND